MATDSPKLIAVEVEEDIVRARQAGRELAKGLGFGAADQTRLATAISELARNVLKYAGSGVCELTARSQQTANSIQVVVTDQGPGIADLEAALGDGFTTGGGLGMGLPGTKRLVDDFEIHSRPGDTRVAITMTRTLR